MTSSDTPDTGAGTPLTAEDAALDAWYREHVLTVYHSPKGQASALARRDSRESWRAPLRAALTAYDAARTRPATDPAGLDALRTWLRHKDWCNVKTDDPPDTERCKCGLAAAIRARLSVADGPGPEERPE